MIFTSGAFVLAFLPLTVLGFYLLGRAGRRSLVLGGLIAASLVFYGFAGPRFVPLLALLIGLNFAFGRALRRTRSAALLALGVALDLAALGYFKYTNLVVGTLFEGAGVAFQPFDIVLPLALSFLTFQQIAYLVDAYAGRHPPHGFLEYCLFSSFFPQMIAGPIVRAQEVIPQLQRLPILRLNGDDVLIGLVIFVIGFDKKVFIADSMAMLADPVFGAATARPPSLIDAWGGALAYTFQLYFDFSGLSDMAIGLARMFGVRYPLNFDSPYKAASIIDFWRRWHMTLSRFLKDYLYIPLGGNRRGRRRRYANVMAVMLLGGLWHGASWTFAAWGGLHGLYLLVNHLWRAVRRRLGRETPTGSPWGRWLGRLVTFVAVVAAWVLFRAPDGASAIVILKGMAGLNGIVLPESAMAAFPALAALAGKAAAGGELMLPAPGESYLWLGVVLAIVWFAPNTQQILSHVQPALDFDRVRAFANAPRWENALGRLTAALAPRAALVLIPLFSGSAVLAGVVAASRGGVAQNFIYMIF